MIVIIQSENSVGSVASRTTADSDARSNMSRERINQTTDGVFRNGSPFPFNHLPQFVFWQRLRQDMQTASYNLPDLLNGLSMNGCTVSRRVSKGCPQGSVIGPFLWNIVFDELLTLDYRNNVFLQAYADDLVVVVSGCRPSQPPRPNTP
ncbi:hypothetical protein LAZ67_7001080 [Cordylochernes scorpioides]|uniref:Reverse transcriptase domain-containing protein n=1 Tax=Cordylochernes scorpioides TaxID=51811 RepID=A0ABY6KLZ5_9ARAC|nr:hypothetical protein LAZ67_7001080 [Cordylochernes scorpioides]